MGHGRVSALPIRAVGSDSRLRLCAGVLFGMMEQRGRIEERCEKGNPAARRVSAKPRASSNDLSLLEAAGLPNSGGAFLEPFLGDKR